MAGFPPNLDDGELWFPSVIIPREEGSSKIFEPNNRPIFMNDLAHRFTTLTLLQRNHSTSNIPPPKFELFRSPVHSDQFARSSHMYLTANRGLDVGHNVTAYETGALSVGPRSFNQYHLLEPAQTHEVERFRQLKASVLQSQQNRSENQGFLNQFGRVRAGSSLVTKLGGTGVFLPRIATTTSNEARKKQVLAGLKNRRGTRMIPPRIAKGKHEDCHCQLSPELDLPQDWTY